MTTGQISHSRATEPRMTQRKLRDQHGLGRLEPIGQTSFVVATAKALRDEILSRDDDEMFLGSEDDLIVRLGVSQPTFRQAARLLEYEELLTVKRGVGGGYFGRRPTAEAVARLAGLYLLSHGTSFPDVMRTQGALEAELIRQITLHSDPAARQRLRDFLDSHPELWSLESLPMAIRAINAFWRLAGELTGNKSLALFSLASQAYGAKSLSLSFTGDRVRQYVAGLSEMCDAMLRGDFEHAIAIRRINNEMMIQWSCEDAGSTR
ncbi:FadR/GntR family transcriptional regulator [Sphingomonas immobilis]|uniref:FCD domain-containing protein n=1 Tax=Sphingomonas immobilis TaxID=3063997 RepID=A0ABT9A2I6_9SPHN|nr:FCD domain-containing protein [Sphingomonas sp. CA1-15]MDO7844043.1 FCD domain-containing protein [Sphingomonas sp. CA1-15]